MAVKDKKLREILSNGSLRDLRRLETKLLDVDRNTKSLLNAQKAVEETCRLVEQQQRRQQAQPPAAYLGASALRAFIAIALAVMTAFIMLSFFTSYAYYVGFTRLKQE